LVAEIVGRENWPAQFNAGMKFYYGGGVPKDLQKAFRRFLRSTLLQILSIGIKNIIFNIFLLAVAEAGDSEAQFIVGYMYQHGKGIKANLSKALAWYRKGTLLLTLQKKFRLEYRTEPRGIARNLTFFRADPRNAGSQTSLIPRGKVSSALFCVDLRGTPG
jgi:TPR repeat protein